MKALPCALSIGVVLLLAACGGGGGGAAAPAATLASVPFTTANYAPTGRASAATLIDVQSSTAIDTPASADAGGSAAQVSTGALDVARFLAGVAASALSGPERPQDSQTASRNCTYGGSVSVTANDANNSNRLDAGDSASSNFSACVLEFGGPAINGGLDFTVQSAGYSGSSLVSLAVGAAFRSLSSGGSTINGTADLSLSETSASISYRSTTSVRGGVTTVYNFTAVADTSGAQDRLTVTGQIGVAGAGFTLSTPSTIIMGSVYPSSGVLRVTDAAGGYVEIVIRPTDFDLDLYLPGDAVRDARTTHTWATLASGSI